MPEYLNSLQKARNKCLQITTNVDVNCHKYVQTSQPNLLIQLATAQNWNFKLLEGKCIAVKRS